jgi:Ca-activated chloride channel family protein
MRRIVMSLIAVALLMPSAVAAAQTEEPPEGAILIILDASGSMNDLDEDEVPFIEKAKQAVLRLIEALPDGLAVGLRVYGHREPNTDPVRGCLDTELVVPVGPLDREAIREAVEGLGASGFTPIGLSLREAAADLPGEGPRSIVLISDGEDTCAPPDPCRVAEELFGAAFDVRIESVGFLIDTGSAAEQQLRCIAEVTGGEYRPAGRAEDLVARLGEVATEVLDWRPPRALDGALDQTQATHVSLDLIPDWLSEEPPTVARGRYAGLLMPGETRWFQTDLWEAERMWVWADLGWPPGLEVTGDFKAIIIDPAGNRVETPIEGSNQSITLPATESPMLGVTVTDPPQGYPPAGTYLVGFHWDAPAEVFLGSVFFEIDMVVGRDTLPALIEGSLDPAAAPVLELTANPENEATWKGALFRGPIASGETRWYRLDLERGEVMNVLALFPAHRVVGFGTEGEFAVLLTDTEGTAVGGPLHEWPQMRQAFGPGHDQARVSGTTSLDPNPLPETVLIGFSWEGPAGQQSEIHFEAETNLDEERLAWYDQQPEGETDEPPDAATTTPTVTAAPEPEADEPTGATDDGMPLAVFIVIGVAVITAGVVVPLAVMRRRSHRS